MNQSARPDDMGSHGLGASHEQRDGRWGVARLRALEQAGVPLSRNKSFGVFAEPQNRAALRTYHFLSRLGRELLRAEADGRGRLLGSVDGDGTVELTITVPWLASRRVVFLCSAEVEWMREDAAVADVLDRLGVGGAPRQI